MTKSLIYLQAQEPSLIGGGSEVRARAIVDALASQGIDASLRLIAVPGGWRRRVRQMLGVLRGVPPTFGRLAPCDVAAYLPEDATGTDVVAGTLWISAAMRPRHRRRSILDAHDVESEVFLQASRSGSTAGTLRRALYRITAWWSRAFEKHVARQHATVWAVTDRDQAWFGRARRDASVALVPNACSPPREPVEPSEHTTLVFVGSLNASFNREGIGWFIDTCLPKVRTQFPEIALVIAGAGSDDLSQPGVVALGRVASVDDVYRQARAAIVPLQSGGGSRLKVPEAMGWGVPVVTTSVGVSGYDVTETDGVLVADDAEAFAEACITLLRDGALADELGRAARQRAVAGLTWTSSVRAVLNRAGTA